MESRYTMESKKRFELKGACIRLVPGKKLYSEIALTGPSEIATLMRNELREMDRETVMVVNLNCKLKPISYHIVSSGAINSSPIEMANIFKTAILSNAKYIMMAHNHPSGDITPSGDDIRITKKVVDAGKLMEIYCLDHIIVGADTDDWYSFHESGLVNFNNSQTLSAAAE